MHKDKALKRFVLTLALYTGALIVTYSSVLRVPYAFSDTYTGWAAALKHHLWGIEHQMVVGGRPLYALLTALSFPDVLNLTGSNPTVTINYTGQIKTVPHANANAKNGKNGNVRHNYLHITSDQSVNLNLNKQ